MNDAPPPLPLDDWLGLRGPGRRALLAPLRAVLVAPPGPPCEVERMVQPARWLLEAAGKGRFSLTSDGYLKRGFAAKANRDLGFGSPPYTPDGEETVLEIDMLLQTLCGLDLIDQIGKRAFLTHLGHAYFNDPVALWYTLGSCLGLARPPGFTGELWELILAWLIQEDVDHEALERAISETADAYGDVKSADRGLDEARLDVAFFSLYTALRAINAFVPRPPDATGKPRLTSGGRLAAIEGLRAAVATLECPSVA